ncbi:hypothetical protein QZH41_005214 [Actinostola sp. cb2023]|nr:hypothetical protein QZH41_005214 [Actinostola sp. cb2023]
MTGSGKTVWVQNLLQHASRVIQPPPQRILWSYSQWQPTYEQMQQTLPGIEFVKGIPHDLDEDWYFDPKVNNLIVIDDQMADNSNDKRIMNLFTKGSHHRNLSVIFLCQNVYFQGKIMRTLSLNAAYLVLFKNPRDKLQITTLGKQMYPGKTDQFLHKYEAAVERPYGYLFVDLKPNTPEECRLRTNVLPNDPPQTGGQLDAMKTIAEQEKVKAWVDNRLLNHGAAELQPPSETPGELITENKPQIDAKRETADTETAGLKIEKQDADKLNAKKHTAHQSEQMTYSSVLRNQAVMMKLTMLQAMQPIKFTGNPADYPTFRNRLKDNLEDGILSDTQKSEFLPKFLSGETYEVAERISGCSYEDTMKILEQRYGQPGTVAAACIENLTRGPKLQNTDYTGLRNFAEQLESASRKLLGAYESEVSATTNLKQIISRLPNYLINKWGDTSYNIRERGAAPKLSDLAAFVKRQAAIKNDPCFVNSGSTESKGRAAHCPNAQTSSGGAYRAAGTMSSE